MPYIVTPLDDFGTVDKIVPNRSELDTSTGGIKYSYPNFSNLSELYIPGTKDDVMPFTIVSNATTTYIVSVQSFLWGQGTRSLNSSHDSVVFSIFKFATIGSNMNVVDDPLHNLKLVVNGQKFLSRPIENFVNGNFVSIPRSDLTELYGPTTKFYVTLTDVVNGSTTNRGELKIVSTESPPADVISMVCYKLANRESIQAKLTLPPEMVSPLGLVWSLYTAAESNFTEYYVSEPVLSTPFDADVPHEYTHLLYNAEYNDETRAQKTYEARSNLVLNENYFIDAVLYYRGGCNSISYPPPPTPDPDSPEFDPHTPIHGFVWDYRVDPVINPVLTQTETTVKTVTTSDSVSSKQFLLNLILTGELFVPDMSSLTIEPDDVEIHPKGVVIAVQHVGSDVTYYKQLYDFVGNEEDKTLAYGGGNVWGGVNGNDKVQLNKALGNDDWYWINSDESVPNIREGVSLFRTYEKTTINLADSNVFIFVINGYDTAHVTDESESIIPIGPINVLPYAGSVNVKNGDAVNYENSVLLELDSGSENFSSYKIVEISGNDASEESEVELTVTSTSPNKLLIPFNDSNEHKIAVIIGSHPYKFTRDTQELLLNTVLYHKRGNAISARTYVNDVSPAVPFISTQFYSSDVTGDATLFGGYMINNVPNDNPHERTTISSSLTVYGDHASTEVLFSSDPSAQIPKEQVAAKNDQVVGKYTSEEAKQGFKSKGGILNKIKASVTGPNSTLEVYNSSNGDELGTFICTSNIGTNSTAGMLTYTFNGVHRLVSENYYIFKVINGSAHIASQGLYGHFSNQTNQSGAMKFEVYVTDETTISASPTLPLIVNESIPGVTEQPFFIAETSMIESIEVPVTPATSSGLVIKDETGTVVFLGGLSGVPSGTGSMTYSVNKVLNRGNYRFYLRGPGNPLNITIGENIKINLTSVIASTDGVFTSYQNDYCSSSFTATKDGSLSKISVYVVNNENNIALKLKTYIDDTNLSAGTLLTVSTNTVMQSTTIAGVYNAIFSFENISLTKDTKYVFEVFSTTDPNPNAPTTMVKPLLIFLSESTFASRSYLGGFTKSLMTTSTYELFNFKVVLNNNFLEPILILPVQDIGQSFNVLSQGTLTTIKASVSGDNSYLRLYTLYDQNPFGNDLGQSSIGVPSDTGMSYSFTPTVLNPGNYIFRVFNGVSSFNTSEYTGGKCYNTTMEDCDMKFTITMDNGVMLDESNHETVNTYTSLIQTQVFKSTKAGVLHKIKATVSGPSSFLRVKDLNGVVIATSDVVVPSTNTFSTASTYNFGYTDAQQCLLSQDTIYSFEVVNGTAHLAYPGTYEESFSPDVFSDMNFEVLVYVPVDILKTLETASSTLLPMNVPFAFVDGKTYYFRLTVTVTEESNPTKSNTAYAENASTFYIRPQIADTQDIFIDKTDSSILAGSSRINSVYSGPHTIKVKLYNTSPATTTYQELPITVIDGVRTPTQLVFTPLPVSTYRYDITVVSPLYNDTSKSYEVDIGLGPLIVQDAHFSTNHPTNQAAPIPRVNGADMPSSVSEYYTCKIYTDQVSLTEYSAYNSLSGTYPDNAPLADNTQYYIIVTRVVVVKGRPYYSDPSARIAMDTKFYDRATLPLTQDIFVKKTDASIIINGSSINKVYSGPHTINVKLYNSTETASEEVSFSVTNNVVTPAQLTFTPLSVGTYRYDIIIQTELHNYHTWSTYQVDIGPGPLNPERVEFFTGDSFKAAAPRIFLNGGYLTTTSNDYYTYEIYTSQDSTTSVSTYNSLEDVYTTPLVDDTQYYVMVQQTKKYGTPGVFLTSEPSARIATYTKFYDRATLGSVQDIFVKKTEGSIIVDGSLTTRTYKGPHTIKVKIYNTETSSGNSVMLESNSEEVSFSVTNNVVTPPQLTFTPLSVGTYMYVITLISPLYGNDTRSTYQVKINPEQVPNDFICTFYTDSYEGQAVPFVQIPNISLN